ncbi:hypothetical protein PN462_12480 [Spirulina sp. CS-785/01]|uniref:Npun_F0494 family protein n=1 Tax=Spirulina sp. CS-785/01 TaxID=3021716 RepID=UPI0023303967|nr:Npun_F0494 family protein [Spirulina sp. CS-785/01]MDB9313921.1 hypothetical protein [Spirulina sp. CS-785/01]
MTSTLSSSTAVQYAPKTVERAKRALSCSPFCLILFLAMRSQSVPLKAIASQTGQQNGYTRHTLPELAAENALLWLIQVGVLRREVDGQGITDSFRLTPLGREIVKKWEQQPGSIPRPSLGGRLKNALNRWLRLPI